MNPLSRFKQWLRRRRAARLAELRQYLAAAAMERQRIVGQADECVTMGWCYGLECCKELLAGHDSIVRWHRRQVAWLEKKLGTSNA